METVDINKIKIGDYDIYFEPIDENKGKIVITTSSGDNYSYFWGAMGNDLYEFIYKINADYFASKLVNDIYSFDVKLTFTNLRRHINDEIFHGYYNQMKFQKHMRNVLKSFQQECEGNDERYFVDNFKSSFIDNLDFTLIMNDNFIVKDFKDLWSTPWDFIEKSTSYKHGQLVKLHKKIKQYIKKEKLCKL